MEGAASVLLTPGGEVGKPDLVVSEIGLGGSLEIMRGELLRGRLSLLVDNLGDALATGNILSQRGYVIDIVLSADEIVPDRV